MRLYNIEELQSTTKARFAFLVLPTIIASALIAFICGIFIKQTQPWVITGSRPRLQCSPDGLIHSNLWEVTGLTCYNGFGSLRATEPYNLHWDPALFISITLGFGHFTFPIAKAIDVFWDLIIGRGGQLLLIVLVYPTTRMVVILVMEEAVVSLPMLTNTLFERMPLTTMFTVLRSISSGLHSCRSPGFGARLLNASRLTKVFLCGVYIIAFPTIMSAMTGYQAELTPYLSVPPQDSGILVDASQIVMPKEVLLDGSRIGLPNQFPTNNLDAEEEDILLSYNSCAYDLFFLGRDSISDEPMNRYLDTNFQCTTSNITFGPFYSGHWWGEDCVEFNSSIFLHDTNYTLGFPPVQVYSQPMLQYTKYYSLPDLTNSTFTKDWVLENSFCRPANTYQWGFASLLLFMFCLMTSIFALILCLLRWDIYWNSRAGRLKGSISVLRDAIDLTAELNAQLGAHALRLTASELEQRAQRQKLVVSLETNNLPISRRNEAKLHRGTKSSNARSNLTNSNMEQR